VHVIQIVRTISRTFLVLKIYIHTHFVLKNFEPDPVLKTNLKKATYCQVHRNTVYIYIYTHIHNILHTQRLCRRLKSFDTLALSTVRTRYIVQNKCVLLLPVQGTRRNNSEQPKLNIFKFSTDNTNCTSSWKYKSKQTKENFVRRTKDSYCVLKVVTAYQRQLLCKKDSYCVKKIVAAYQR
jgi:hypothetical protein